MVANPSASQQKHALGTFLDRQDLEAALQALQNSGFPMNQVSVVAREIAPEDTDSSIASVQVSDRLADEDVNPSQKLVENTAAAGATGFTLLGLTSLAIPGLGVVLAAGSLAAAMVATVASMGVAAVESNHLVKTLTDAGIPEVDARVYSDRLQQGYYLVMVEGDGEEIQRVEAPLRDQGIQDWSTHSGT